MNFVKHTNLIPNLIKDLALKVQRRIIHKKHFRALSLSYSSNRYNSHPQ